MGRKYIIELEDKPFHKEDGDFLYRVKGFNSLVFDLTGISKLTPYAEPDLEQVRKEAYEDGFKNAVHNCPEGCPYVEQARNEAYQRGYEQGYKDGYNEPGKRKIQVGDEVKCIRADWTAIVTKIKEGHMTLMGNDGAVANGYDEKDFIKTGRHFPEIAEVLRKMKENSDGNL